MSNNHTVKFALEYDTKGAVRFVEVDDKGNPKKTDNENAVIGTLYFRKKGAKLNGNLPKGATLEVKFEA